MARSLKRLFEILRECYTPPKGGEWGNLANADGLIALSFGDKKSSRFPEAGVSNQALARLVMAVNDRYFKETGQVLVLAVQTEIADYLSRTLARKSTILTPVGYADTRQVILSAKKLLQKDGKPIKRLAVVAHHRHFDPRIKWALKAAGYEVVFTPHLIGIPYDPQNGQFWVRSEKVFQFRELLACLAFWFRGWI